MKPFAAAIITAAKAVLNPHGSDETNRQYNSEKTIVQVLNPHGSDETKLLFSFLGFFSKFLTHTVQMKQIRFKNPSYEEEDVLNPHGSDEIHCQTFEPPPPTPRS